jgi:hypothetical protein
MSSKWRVSAAEHVERALDQTRPTHILLDLDDEPEAHVWHAGLCCAIPLLQLSSPSPQPFLFYYYESPTQEGGWR